MGHGHKFDPARIERLNDPGRLATMNPDLILAASGVADPDVVVEVGAGTGFFARQFAQRLPSAQIIACDVLEVMVTWMRANLDRAELERIKPVRSDESALPVRDGGVDWLYMINVHHELDDRPVMLAEAKRVLKPGGILTIVDWKDIKTEHGPPVEHRIREQVIRKEIEAAGFTPVETEVTLPEHNVVVGRKPR